ncbi:MAG: hydroxymyristoyl-ACP dehydratase [Bacteroidetes bacterium]|nr:hydroxymyristoyl-ACP dehydratase [Bacteroidota bacterium]
MLATKETILTLIPQRPPMVMVDKLIYSDEQKAITGFSIREGNIFCSKGRFLEAGLIENMAQSAALHTGWMARQQTAGKMKKPAVGVIGALKNLRVFRLPEVNSEIKTEITVLTKIFNASMISGRVKAGDDVLAECEMKIFLQE